MTEILSETTIVRSLADHVARRISKSVIRALINLRVTLSAEDSGLKNTWDEICAQIQYEESFSWDAYEETARGFISGSISELPRHELEAVWLQTDAGSDWDCEDPDQRDRYPVFEDDVIEHILREYVFAEAGRWSNRRIRAFIDRSGMRD